MKLDNYTVEYQVGRVSMVQSNILVQDIKDMDVVEYWEERLTTLKQPFVIAFRKVEDKILYSIFTDMRGKESAFR